MVIVESSKTSRKKPGGVVTLHWSLMRQRAWRRKVKVKVSIGICSAAIYVIRNFFSRFVYEMSIVEVQLVNCSRRWDHWQLT